MNIFEELVRLAAEPDPHFDLSILATSGPDAVTHGLAVCSRGDRTDRIECVGSTTEECVTFLVAEIRKYRASA